MVTSDRVFIFHMCNVTPFDKTFPSVPRSRLSVKVKVKYQGEKKNCRCRGIRVSQYGLLDNSLSLILVLD